VVIGVLHHALSNVLTRGRLLILLQFQNR
jgi:hypothetical protein